MLLDNWRFDIWQLGTCRPTGTDPGSYTHGFPDNTNFTDLSLSLKPKTNELNASVPNGRS